MLSFDKFCAFFFQRSRAIYFWHLKKGALEKKSVRDGSQHFHKTTCDRRCKSVRHHVGEKKNKKNNFLHQHNNMTFPVSPTPESLILGCEEHHRYVDDRGKDVAYSDQSFKLSPTRRHFYPVKTSQAQRGALEAITERKLTKWSLSC